MNSSQVDVLIVGAGPAGLAAAIELRKSGVKKVRVVEREQVAGGVPRHSFHPGYGIRDLKRFMSGPKYAKYYVEQAIKAGVELSTSTTAIEWADQKKIKLTSPFGIEEVAAKAIILATGARERGRAARKVAGKRPAGIYTTGSLQQATYLEQLYIGKRAVIIGCEHVSLSAILTLRHAGVKTVAIICEEAKHKTVFMLPTLMSIIFRFKLHLATKVIEIIGEQRVSEVLVEKSGKRWAIPADTIIFTGDWIPDHELARRAHFPVDLQYKSPITDRDGLIPGSNVYVIGNLKLPIKGADKCAIEGKRLARKIANKLR